MRIGRSRGNEKLIVCKKLKGKKNEDEHKTKIGRRRGKEQITVREKEEEDEENKEEQKT